MKKMLCALLSLTVIFGVGNVFAKLTLSGSSGSSSIGTSSKMEDVEKANKTRQAANIKKQADEFDKKAASAEKAGNKELAELYKKCAECCKTIAAAVESDSKDSALANAQKDLRELKKQVREYETGAKKPVAAAAPADK
jgi:hypothetical protein